jgi:hypothetical protein
MQNTRIACGEKAQVQNQVTYEKAGALKWATGAPRKTQGRLGNPRRALPLPRWVEVDPARAADTSRANSGSMSPSIFTKANASEPRSTDQRAAHGRDAGWDFPSGVTGKHLT